MRLTHQLILLIVTLLIFVLMGTLFISIKSSQEYLSQQLQTQTQETTMALGLKLSPALLSGDKVLARTITHAIFDRGYYQHVLLKNMEGELISDRTLPVIVEGVPQWFVDMITIQAPVGETIIQDKWKQLAILRLVAHTGHVYHELWQITVSNITWLLLLGVFSFLILSGIIQLVMRPLYAVAKQADEISLQNFSFRPTIPKIPELRQLVLAMNNMAEKVEFFLSEQTKRINKLRTKIYNDKTTGLLNRNGLEVHLNELLENKSESIAGEILLIRVEGLEQVNQEFGYEKGDQYLNLFVEHINNLSDDEWELARLNGKDFILLVLGHNLEGLSGLCEQFQKSVTDKIQELEFYIAGINFQSGQKWGELLSLADITLSQALKSTAKWHVLSSYQEKTIPRLTATQWREKLLLNIDEDAISLKSQTCFASSNDELHHEILLQSEHLGVALPTMAVLSIAQRCNLSKQLDRYVLQKVIELMSASNIRYAVNVTLSSLADMSLLDWIEKFLRDKGINKDRLVLEINEQNVQNQRESLVFALKNMNSKGLSFAFDGVGVSETIFSDMAGMLPCYIKMDGRFSLDIEDNLDHQAMVENIIILAKTIAVPVIAMHVESSESQNILFNLGVDGVQGYYLSKPINVI